MFLIFSPKNLFHEKLIKNFQIDVFSDVVSDDSCFGETFKPLKITKAIFSNRLKIIKRPIGAKT